MIRLAVALPALLAALPALAHVAAAPHVHDGDGLVRWVQQPDHLLVVAALAAGSAVVAWRALRTGR